MLMLMLMRCRTPICTSRLQREERAGCAAASGTRGWRQLSACVLMLQVAKGCNISAEENTITHSQKEASASCTAVCSSAVYTM